MDAIRLRQIYAGLGYDKKINTIGIEKKRVARYPDKRPESQYDADAETTMTNNRSALRVILNNLYEHISIMQRLGSNIVSDQFSNASKDGCTVGVKPKHDVQTDDLEPNAGATEYTWSAHHMTYFADKSYGGNDRQSGCARAHILPCEVD